MQNTIRAPVHLPALGGARSCGTMRILVIDVGGTHVKVRASGQRTPVEIPSGPEMTPKKMAAEVRKATAGWKYDTVSIGYPGPVVHGHPVSDPHNLGPGWVGFDF